ncbi:MAG: family 43 glycosylhydrolase, partial [Candidatus Symbiothrix sp.]|nr:family 43 glycosylhydrolase [Candidatus Symbiothrix sp.]
MKNSVILFLILLSAHVGAPLQTNAQSIVANPMDLNYRFQFDDPGYREAADPVCEYFNGQYYLFASKSGGYWSSPDLIAWNYIPCQTISEIENYAPSILVRNDSLYYIASGTKIYRTAHPDKDDWEQIDTKFTLNVTDPAFFQDEDGKVYLYWGCSDKDPIMGVEVNPLNGFAPIGEPLTLITHHQDKYGWEVQGENNELGTAGWNEGPALLKYNGKYYLQYASPGTQFRIYADGVYVADNPLGPFTYRENSPFSFKPGGFIGGAGHGHTFQDKYGNYWHVATMKISQRHLFERRLGLFPLTITADGTFREHSVWTDYPFSIPDQKTDFETNNLSAGWNLLSYNKPVLASSILLGFLPSYAVNEQVENGWSAQTGNPGEWLQVDLKKPVEVRAIQVNFADRDFTIRAPHPLFAYQYKIEASDNGADWTTIVDKTTHTRDAVHELIVLDKPVQTRYLRITNTKELPGKFSLYGFRIFGNGNGDLPQEVSGVKVTRHPDDLRRFSISWDKQKNADGYLVNVTDKSGRLLNSVMVHNNRYEGGWFNADAEYDFPIEAFNENGITKEKQINAQTRITCIGASITEGARIENPKENSYPGQLQSLLGVNYKVENYGVSSATMLKNGNFPYWKTDAYQKALQSNPDIVFIDLGGNDAKAVNRPFYNELEQDCRDMIRAFKALPTHPRVIVLLPTVFFETDTNGIYDPVSKNEVAPRLQKAAYEEGVEVVDMHPLLIDRPDWIPDKIHPEEKGSEIIAKRLFRQITFPVDENFDIFKILDKKNITYEVSNFAGYECATFLQNGRECKVVKPKKT